MPDVLTSLVSDRPIFVAVAAVVLLLLILRALGRRRPRPRPGEVWFANVPFEDGTGSKDRPVLVLARDGRRWEVARFTSQDRDARSDHVRVPHGMTGLPKASWLNLRPVRLRRSAFRRRTGVPGDAFVSWFRERATRI